MADQPITTSIDDLVKYLGEHGETESSVLAGALKVSDEIVATWADVLEKAQIVKINYRMGKMFISPMVKAKDASEVVQKTVNVKKAVAEAELETQINMIRQMNTKLDEFKRYVTSAEGAFKTKAGEIKDSIDQIDKLDHQVDEIYQKLKSKKDFIDGMSAKLDSEAMKLEQRAKKVESITSNDNDSKRVIADIKAKLDDSESRLKALNSSVNTSMEVDRKNFSVLMQGIKEEMKALKDSLGQHEKEANDYSAFIASYQHDSDAVKRQVTKERAKILDDIAKSSEDARKVYGAAEKQAANIRKMLGEMKSNFGGFSEMSDKLNKLKDNIDEISKQKDALQKELDQIAAQLRLLSTLEGSKVGQKSMQMQQAEENLSNTAKKLDKLNSDTASVKKGIDDISE